jgi:pyrimidine operon attenuation protein / uracil phosphoribosyltransferase
MASDRLIMDKKLILGSQLLDITLSRLAQELIENHQNFDNSIILGLQPKGIYFAEKVAQKLHELSQLKVPLGYLDVTFYRDDFRRRDAPLKANATKIDFIIEGKKVILIDDVLYTGRTTRAALDAMIAFGRPSKVELMVLIDRKYSRDLPSEPTYIGKRVNTLHSQRVQVEWQVQGFVEDNIWLIEKN